MALWITVDNLPSTDAQYTAADWRPLGDSAGGEGVDRERGRWSDSITGLPQLPAPAVFTFHTLLRRMPPPVSLTLVMSNDAAFWSVFFSIADVVPNLLGVGSTKSGFSVLVKIAHVLLHCAPPNYILLQGRPSSAFVAPCKIVCIRAVERLIFLIALIAWLIILIAQFSTGLVYVVGCRQRMTARLAVHDSSTRCDHCRTCHQTMMHSWPINRHLLLIISWILLNRQLHIGTPASENLINFFNRD